MLKIFKIHSTIRFYSIKHAAEEPIKYTATINLPKTMFPNRLSAAKREELEKKLIEGTFAQAYRYQEQHKKDPAFVLHDGPPYANGDLHMGHAVNKILKDITLRQLVANGQKVNYIPGWDCHGLPIELKALSDTAKSAKNGDPKAIRGASRKFAATAVAKQKEELRSWGVLADWNNANSIYLTYSPAYITNQLQLFLDLYERGLVYRDLKPVYWSPSSRTALAEAELEYDPNFISPTVYLRFKLNKLPNALISNLGNQAIYALVWTTTPWTLPSNQAICYNAELEYSIVRLTNESKNVDSNSLYILATNLLIDFQNSTKLSCKVVHSIKGSDMQKCTYNHPIDENQQHMSFYAASHVQDTKGTGLVHTAPAHGPEDFLVSLAEKLPVISYVDENGVYTKDAPWFLRGKDVLTEGDALVLEHISDDIIFAGKFTHSYPIDWRTKKPVILRASEQWFINTDQLKERAVAEIKNIQMYPRVNSVANKKSLLTQVQKRPYWCISRQRAWGVPIPVFYNRETAEVLTNSKIIAHINKLIFEEGNIDFWWSKSVDELLPEELLRELNVSASMLKKGTDIFDIWFDSGSSWSSVLHNEKIADLYMEGCDQFTGWFQSSLLTSIAARNCAPYRSIFAHGFTVDQKGLKMSKSLGNVISPTDIRKKFGVDVLRWWVASHGAQNMAITVSDHLLQQAAENVNKIRSSLRFLNGVIGSRSELPAINTSNQIYLNKYILSKLLDFDQEAQAYYDAFEYNRVIAHVQNYFANQISATYVHLIKDRLYCGNREDIENIRVTLSKCYEVLCKVLWPITPFLIEESWNYYDRNNAFHQKNVLADGSWKNQDAEKVLLCALNVKRLLNQKAKEANTWTLDVSLAAKHDQGFSFMTKLQPQVDVAVSNSELCEILQVGRITLTRAYTEDSIDDFTISIKNIDAKICPRCRRFFVKRSDCICDRCAIVLEK